MKYLGPELWLMPECVQVWCSEAYDRVQTNLGMLKSPTALDNFKTMAKISEVTAFSRVLFRFHDVKVDNNLK